MTELIDEALELADRILTNPDVPNDNIIPLMNRLAALSLRIKYRSVELNNIGEKNESKKYDAVSRGLDELIRTLKIQVKATMTNDFRAHN